MTQQKIVEYGFFFGLLAAVTYLVGAMMFPFITALSLSLIISTVAYPLHVRIVRRTPKQNETVAALFSTLMILVVGILPLSILGAALFNEAVSVYQSVQKENTSSITESITTIENVLQTHVPAFEIDLDAYFKGALSWVTSNAGSVFAGTASAVFTLFITLIGIFYFLRDGMRLRRRFMQVSPLPEKDERFIFNHLARAVRSVTNGIVLVAIIQGTLTGFGLWLFGFENAFIWGVVAAFGALIPNVGTSIVFVPAIAYLFFTSDLPHALGLAIWGMLAVGIIDNILGPYLMGRGNAIHPFLILLSVLGGISVFGFVGFLLGPIVVSLFLVLLELYTIHLGKVEESTN